MHHRDHWCRRLRMRLLVRLVLAALVVISAAIFINHRWREFASTRDVAASYAFVADHPDLSLHLPCFCGCGQREGHTSLDSCFVRRRDEAGAVFLMNTHART